MKIFKYTLFTVLSLGVIGFIASCSDDHMLIYPSEIVDVDYWVNQENAELAVNGCYDVLGWDGGHNTIPFFFGDIIGRDGHKGGDVGGDQEWMDTYIDFSYDNTEVMINTAWSNYYLAIGRCNQVLANVPGIDVISENDKNRMLAEAKFIRAYFFFELVKTFGEVPLVDHVLAPSEYNMGKSPKSEIYALIESDLAYAAKYLPTKSEIGAASYGRATSGAANALRAKAYVYQSKWPQAKALTDSICYSHNEGYRLITELPYEDIFKLENEHNDELIFEIEFYESGDGSFGDENEGNMVCVYMTTRNHPFGGIGGWGFNCPTQEFVDAFEAGDERLEATIIRNGETLWAGTDDEATFNTDFPTNIDRYNNQKYALPASQQATSPYDSPKNWIVIRYADVLLMNAEAAAHTGGDWQTPLNEVRLRAGLEATTATDALQAIYHERRVELGMEGHRFWDVVRQGRGEELYGQFGYVEGVHNHLPIPQEQLDLNGGSY